jgi:hypothetical protein
MADEKEAPSGTVWGTIEIVIVILLIVGLLDHVFGRPNLGSNAPAVKTEQQATVPLDDESSRCGLWINRPITNEKVGTMVTLSGTAGECDWRVSNAVALYAQVIDGKGKPVSGYMPIPIQKRFEGDTSFNSTIALTAKPATGTGYVILVPAVQSTGTKTISTRVPIQF